ncbi:hypothetical protein GCM10027162_01270 [Streptomyces incanus]
MPKYRTGQARITAVRHDLTERYKSQDSRSQSEPVRTGPNRSDTHNRTHAVDAGDGADRSRQAAD